MKRLSIVKLGSTFPDLAARQGDFEQWVAEGLGPDAPSTAVADPTSLPEDPASLCGVILTGSHAMVSQGEAWSKRTGQWLCGVVQAGVPVLGICYGHQLLADVFGGRVGRNPAGREFGTVRLTLEPAAAEDSLLAGLAGCTDGPRVQTCHAESVLDAPPGAVVLARSEVDACHAFRLGACAWGVQFHPEFDARATRHYVQAYRGELAGEGQAVEEILDGIAETPESAAILRRFAALAGA